MTDQKKATQQNTYKMFKDGVLIAEIATSSSPKSSLLFTGGIYSDDVKVLEGIKADFELRKPVLVPTVASPWIQINKAEFNLIMKQQ